QSAFNDVQARKMDGSLFRELPNTVAIYSETALWPIPGNDKYEEVACLSLPAPALDTSDQPNWNYYMPQRQLDLKRYKTEMEFLAQMVVEVLLDNMTTAFDGKGIRRLLLSRYGQESFLSGLNDNDAEKARNAYYESLVYALTSRSEDLKKPVASL